MRPGRRAPSGTRRTLARAPESPVSPTHFLRPTAVAVLVALFLAAPSQADGKRYAVIVGVNGYDHAALAPLEYAEADAADLAAILGAGGYDVRLLTGAAGKADPTRSPTKANVEAVLKGTLDGCKRDDLVLVALAGHGLQFDGDKDAHFCPRDAKPFPDRTDTLVSLQGLYGQLEECGAGAKLLLVDACRNDPKGGRGRGATGAGVPTPRGLCAVYSCSPGERAYEHKALGHGVFFHHVLEGLKEKARDADGEVTVDSLALYVVKQVPRRVPDLVGGGARQTPILNRSELTGGSPVLLAKAGAAAGGRTPEVAGSFMCGACGVDRRARAEDRLLYRLCAAAALGAPDAQFSIGSRLEQGVGFERSPAAARGWYRTAGEKGHPKAAEALKRVAAGG